MARARTTPTTSLDPIRGRATIPVWHPTEPSLAGVLGVGRATAYTMAERGDVPGVLRIGARVVIACPALLAWLGERPVSTHNQDSQRPDQAQHEHVSQPTPGALTDRGA